MRLFIFLLILSGYVSVAQKKDTIFLDLKGNEITRSIFKASLSPVFRAGYGTRDGRVTAQIFDLEGYFDITALEIKELKSEISALSGQAIDSSSILVFDYIGDYGSCYGNKSHPRDHERRKNMLHRYYRFIKDNQDVKYFFITQKPNWRHLSDKLPVVVDINQYVKKRFFPTADFFCPSVVIVHPLGAYYIHRDEHRIETVDDVLKTMRAAAAKQKL